MSPRRRALAKVPGAILGDGGRNKDSMQLVQDFGCQVLQGIRADLDFIRLGFAALVYTPGCTFAAPQGCR